MSAKLSITFLLPLVWLAGCTVATTPAPLASASSSIDGNWQIQSGTAITSPPTAPYLVGALQGSNSALTGTFTTTRSSAVNSTVESYTGTYNTSTSVLTLDSTLPLPAGQTTVALAIPPDPTDFSVGNLTFQCGLCNSASLTSAVGVQVAPLNGTYTGILTGALTSASPSTTTPISGTASLTLTQSGTPDSSGRFPITGIVTFPSSSGLSPATIPGLVRGITIELSSEGCFAPFATVDCEAIAAGSILNAYTNPTATQITVTSFGTYAYGTSGSLFGVGLTGTLTLQ